MTKQGKLRIVPTKKPVPFWKVVAKISLAWLSFVLVLAGLCLAIFGCGKSPLATLAGERVWTPEDLKCWLSGGTFTCKMPEGMRIDNFLIVGKLRFDVDQQLIQECMDEGLIRK
jgi:hypothetical protein